MAETHLAVLKSAEDNGSPDENRWVFVGDVFFVFICVFLEKLNRAMSPSQILKVLNKTWKVVVKNNKFVQLYRIRRVTNLLCEKRSRTVKWVMKIIFSESLILAQNERWRHGLGMQVERVQQCTSGARVRNAWVIYPQVWNSSWKRELIPDEIIEPHGLILKAAMRLRRSSRPIS